MISKISLILMLFFFLYNGHYLNADPTEALFTDESTIFDESSESSDNKEGKEISLPPIIVVSEHTMSTASDNTVRNRDFMNYPRRTASDLMRFIPGLYITQHTGGAKAHQIFLRGFDAEHGQDIAGFLDGIPINESSHVHGQGYLDLHFIIPECIEKIWVMKGPYDPRFGNFATAGVINFIPYKKRDFNYSADASSGNKKTVQGIAHLFKEWYGMNSYVVIEGDQTEGYTDPGKLQAGRGFVNQCIPISDKSELRILYAGYETSSEAADILPKKYIDAGLISRFDSLDDSNRVDVSRHILGLTYELSRRDIKARAQAYFNYKKTKIFSNYTFYYLNPEMGDQLEQNDSRHYAGLQGYLRKTNKVGNIKFNTEGGMSLRSDFIDQTQANTADRQRFNVINTYDFTETALGVYLDERITLAQWIKFIIGIRYDIIWLNGDGEQDIHEFDIYTNTVQTNHNNPVSFRTYSYAVSPKASAIFSPIRQVDIFLNYGQGLVSKEARHLAWEEDHTIPIVVGGEMGSRLRLWNGIVNCAASVWIAEKESESVFDSEFGTNIPKGESRRTGVDFENRISPWHWIYIGTDINYVRARFVQNNDPIPNMCELLITNVISIIHPCGFKGALRGRYLGKREHDLNYTSKSNYVTDLLTGYEIGHLSITLSIENIFNTKWYDSVFAYASRPFKNGAEAEGLHVTPGAPRMWQFRIGLKF
ncbi:MAG: TonB-dependent receptor [Spirochaetota bacterium]|nr:TonB-dependent receptor [Spirochaetota bacterium]